MGVKLWAEIVHGWPCELIDAERVLLAVLAEDANDQTREGWPGMDELVARTHKGASTVRRLLTSLEHKKMITRVPAPVAAESSPVVAHRGRRTVYRILPMPDGKALTCEHLPAAEGAHVRAKRRSRVSRKALTGEHPPLRSPQVPSPPTAAVDVAAVAEARAVLLERTGIDVGDAWAAVVATSRIGGRRNITRQAPWLRAVLEREPNIRSLLPDPDAAGS